MGSPAGATPIESQSTTTDVLIIGAGVAGLAAAREVSASGLRVIVLEARDRAGGRIHTIRDPDAGVPIELGAEFVHGRPPETFAIVESAKLMLADIPERHWQHRDGLLIKSGEFWAELEELMEGMKHVKERDLSFAQYLELYCQNASSDVRAIAAMFIEGFHAARTDKISIRSLIQGNDAADQIDGDKQFRILNGYDRVVDYLQRESTSKGATVLLQTVVQKVRWREHDVEVSALSKQGPRVFKARTVIVTLPLGVLKAPLSDSGAVRFTPPLESRETAARNLEMGNVIKIALRFREPFWERLEVASPTGQSSLRELGFLHATNESIPTWWTQSPVRTPILVGWSGGPEADELCKHEESYIRDRALDALEHLFKLSKRSVAELLESSYMFDWSRDPFARGAYSYAAVGGLDAQEELARPVGDTLFFAGEATNTSGHSGTVHGAIATGVRAGREVIDSLHSSPK